MTKSFKKAHGPFFMLPGELISGEYLLNRTKVETKLSEYLGPDGLAAYTLIGNKQNGEREHDENLICTYEEAAHLMSRPTFSKMLFRLWAYRMIAVREWGRRKRKPSRYQLINKWRTLIRMPDRLERIHKLVSEYERVQRLKLNPSRKKWSILLDIKSKIRKVIV